MLLYHDANASDVDQFSTHRNGTNGSHQEQRKATARAEMPTSLIHRRLLMEQNRIQRFISEDIRGLMRIYDVCGVKDERAWDLSYDIIILDPVTTRQVAQFKGM